MQPRLCSSFFRWAADSPNRPALEVGDTTLTYGALARSASAIAATLLEHAHENGPPLTGVLAHRSPTAFAAILGVPSFERPALI